MQVATSNETQITVCFTITCPYTSATRPYPAWALDAQRECE